MPAARLALEFSAPCVFLEKIMRLRQTFCTGIDVESKNNGEKTCKPQEPSLLITAGFYFYNGKGKRRRAAAVYSGLCFAGKIPKYNIPMHLLQVPLS